MENWKQVKDAKAIKKIYFVSDLGRIKVVSEGAETIKIGYMAVNGYLAVTFGNSDRRNVHALVGEYFCYRPEGSECINHKNGIKTDNRAVNLEWVTYAENNRHAYATGLNTGYGENHHKAIDKETVYKIYELKKGGKKLYEVAKLIDLNYGTLKGIYRGKNWRHEYQEFFGEKYKKLGRSGSVCWKAIPEKVVIDIYARKKTGGKIFEIAKELNLNYATVKSIYHGKNWKHLYKEHFGVL